MSLIWTDGTEAQARPLRRIIFVAVVAISSWALLRALDFVLAAVHFGWRP